MAATILHLVDEHGAPVPSQVRLAVESAYRWAVREYRHIDQAVLAGLAESVAVGMCRRLDQIGFPRRYAFAALTGKLQEWYRAHPVVEIAVGPDDIDRFNGPRRMAASATEMNLLFSEIKARLSERDRQILVLLEQDLGPKEIAKAFDISYVAAAKAIQRARDRMAAILSGTGSESKEDEDEMPRSRTFNLKIW